VAVTARVALVTGATGLVGRALVARLRESGARVLATARTYEAERSLLAAGAEPLHTDVANIGRWSRESSDAEVIFHLGLPRLDPPLRRLAARRRAGPAAAAAGALAELADGRPVVMLSTGLAFGDRTGPACDDDATPDPCAVAVAALAAERALAGADLRVVRVPWIHGPGGLARDLIVGLRIGRFRVVGDGENRWSMLGADDAAAALMAALGAPPGVYTAAEAEVPTQSEVVNLVCTVPGHRRPDRLPLGLAALSMGGAMSEALSSSLWIRSGRLADHGWAPRQDWREQLVSLAEGSLPLPRP
jgi:nucleoside-diphosphate-sugar epimerase